MRLSKTAPLLLTLLLVPGLLPAQDITGLWNITAEFFLAESNELAEQADCLYSGTGISLVQNGNDVSGTVDLDLDSGLPDCPGAIISGTLAATLKGSSFTGTLTGSQLLGSADVKGTVGTPTTSAIAAAMLTMTGSAGVRGGNFSGSSGSFGGQQLAAVPTLGPAAIGVMALILFGGTIFLLTRRERASV